MKFETEKYKTSRKKHRRKSLLPWVKQRFLRLNTKSAVHKRKNGQIGLHQNVKILFFEHYKENERTGNRLEKIYAKYVSDKKTCIQKIHLFRKTTLFFFLRAKGLNRYFTKYT